MSPKEIPGILAKAGAMTGVTLLLFLLVEGAASAAFSTYVLLFRDIPDMREERSHAEYDELLGWVNRPNLVLPDLYGPGVGFRSNSQRFRANRDHPAVPAAGTTRLICSGDSFTMGHSVGDDETWCALLGHTVPGLETVNMGMAAYGIDQVFLWYRRDGAVLQHQTQVFAFITSDFERMAYDNFMGYPKPYLRLAEGRLEVANVPVPKKFSGIPGRQRVQEAVSRLAVVQAGLSVLRRMGMKPAEMEGRVLDDAEVRAVTSAVFEELQRLNQAKGSTLVLVYLPRTGDKEGRASDPWRAFVRGEAERIGAQFVDLVDVFRGVPLDEGEQLFMRPYQPSHYNARGNAWVAEQLAQRLFPAAKAVP